MSNEITPQGAEGSESRLSRLDEEDITRSIDLACLFVKDLTASGSFDLGTIQRSSFGKLLDALPTLALLLDGTSTIVFANDVYREAHTADDPLTGCAFSRLFPRPDDAARVKAHLEAVLMEREAQVFEAILELGTNKIWSRTHLRSIRLGKDRLVLAFTQDLTLERKQLILRERHERELRKAHNQLEHRVVERTKELLQANESLKREVALREQAEAELQRAYDLLERRVEERTAELQRAYDEMKRFTYIVSHDLRVPLMNIKVFSRRLKALRDPVQSASQAQGSDAFAPEIAEAYDFIDSSIGRMERFVNAVMKLSRLGGRELRLEEVDVNEIVQATLKSLGHIIADRGVTVKLKRLPRIIADRISMEQIIGNILTNAVNYLDPQRPGIIEVSSHQREGEIEFRFKDNGRGIRPEEMHKVFEFFRRAGKHDVPGEGMGLAYVRTLVNRHGGRIWCDSQFGEGSVFRFTVSVCLQEGGGRP